MSTFHTTMVAWSFRDVKLHGHFDIVSLVSSEVVPGQLQQQYNQSQILHDIGTTSWSIGVNNPPLNAHSSASSHAWTHGDHIWCTIYEHISHWHGHMVFWGPQTPWSLWHCLLGGNGRGPKTSSTADHKFYKALGRLHGPIDCVNNDLLSLIHWGCSHEHMVVIGEIFGHNRLRS